MITRILFTKRCRYYSEICFFFLSSSAKSAIEGLETRERDKPSDKKKDECLYIIYTHIRVANPYADLRATPVSMYSILVLLRSFFYFFLLFPIAAKIVFFFGLFVDAVATTTIMLYLSARFQASRTHTHNCTITNIWRIDESET